MNEETSELSNFEISVELFSGPIDLLLHLVKRSELPIEKLSLSQVTHQYMLCLERMRALDLDVAAEYLVIAATLVSIKASVLLNEPVELVLDDDGLLVDPHEELLRRLREAQVYREGAFSLSCRKLLGLDVFPAPSLLDEVKPPPEEYRPHDSLLLGKAFKALLERSGVDAAVMTIQFDSTSIVERMMSVLNLLESGGGKLAFAAVVPDLSSKGSLIISFIALLELCKRGLISVWQAAETDEITVSLTGTVPNSAELSSEFDAPAPQTVNA